MGEFAFVRGGAVLQSLLSELARALLLRGMPAKAFTELARIAFVSAAAATSKFDNGKVNCSRIAAQTGLSRTEVRRLLGSANSRLTRLYASPLDQVISGWCNDRQFTDRSGRPRILNISGPGRSFAALAESYAGDIPYRAILEELKVIGAVRVDDRTVSYVRRNPLHRHDFNFLATVVRTLPRKLNSSRDERAKRLTKTKKAKRTFRISS